MWSYFSGTSGPHCGTIIGCVSLPMFVHIARFSSGLIVDVSAGAGWISIGMPTCGFRFACVGPPQSKQSVPGSHSFSFGQGPKFAAVAAAS